MTGCPPSPCTLPATLARAAISLFLILTAFTPPACGQDWTGDARKALDLFGDALGGSSRESPDDRLPLSRIVEGLKQALVVATDRAVTSVGATNGYLGNPEIHIPLPDSLRQAQSLLRRVGLGSLGDTLERRLNHAAERAAPEAQAVFFESITQMTLRDAERILKGPDDAATQYFRRTMSAPLKRRLRPIVDQAVAEAQVVQAYEAMMGGYREALPFLPDVQTDLTGYTLEKGLDGLFHVVAQEEARIRKDPAARTTELLRQVFGGL